MLSLLFGRRRSMQSRLISAAIALCIFFALRFIGLPPKTFSTDMTTDLPSHHYNVPPSMAATFAATYAAKKLRWTVVSSDPGAWTVTLESKRPFSSWYDDLTVHCTPITDRDTQVSISSLGNYNGESHIRALQAGMDEKLPSAP